LPGGDLLGGDVVVNTVGEVLNLDSGGVVETATGAVESATSLADLGGIAGGDVGGNLPALGDFLGGVTEQNPLGGGLLGGLGGSSPAAASDAEGRSFLRRGR
jgi:hypothetical protein